MEQIILNALNNRRNITQVQDSSFIKMYSGKSYQYIYKFIYSIDTLDIPMVIGVPEDWDRKLIDVYIENYREFKYIPHLDREGKLCLFDLEGVLIDKDFEGLLNQTLDRMDKTLVEGLNELNKKDFIEEFEQYWGKLPNTKVLKSMIRLTKNTKIIKYADNKKQVKKDKKDNYIDFLRKQNKYIFVCSDSEKDFNTYKDINAIRNGIYIYIDTEEYIYPPDWRNKLDIGYVNNLLKHTSLDKNEFMQYLNKCKRDLLLVFNIKQPNDCINILGVVIKGYNISILSEIPQIKSYKELIPCMVIRCDKEFLVYRGGSLSDLCNKKILVIGCGSIGGYLVSELVKTGINDITIVDNDILKEENIFRHILGMEYINEYKSKALVDYINKNIPYVNIKSFEDTIEDAIYDGNISFFEYDLIISAVGNHNLNRWINEYVHTEGIKTPVIYLWNEVLGIGNHVAFLSTNYRGCYECFFGECEEGIYDKTSYCEKGQSFTKKIRGCGSSFLPFSSTNSVVTVTTGVEIIRNYFEGRINKNVLISIKGDNYYFKRAGFKTSNRYNAQLEPKIIVEGEKFRNERCLICGGK
jgi:molybdopterin/thiamine biosynthesis adenylyltransferase